MHLNLRHTFELKKRWTEPGLNLDISDAPEAVFVVTKRKPTGWIISYMLNTLLSGGQTFDIRGRVVSSVLREGPQVVLKAVKHSFGSM